MKSRERIGGTEPGHPTRQFWRPGFLTPEILSAGLAPRFRARRFLARNPEFPKINLISVLFKDSTTFKSHAICYQSWEIVKFLILAITTIFRKIWPWTLYFHLTIHITDFFFILRVREIWEMFHLRVMIKNSLPDLLTPLTVAHREPKG